MGTTMSRVGSEKWRWLHWFRLVGLLLIAAAVGTGCMASDKTVIAQASQFNDGIKPAVIEQPQNMDYMQRIGDRVIAAAKECDAEHIGPKSHFSDKDRDW